VCAGHRRGYKKRVGRVGGVMAEKPGDVRECAWAGPRRRAERAELTGLAHSAEGEERDARGNGSTTGDPGPRDRERERERAGGGNRRRQVGPTWQRAREGARGGEWPLTGGVCLSGTAGARARDLAGLNWVRWATGLLSFFLFLWIF
jgi:hypothetical protein